MANASVSASNPPYRSQLFSAKGQAVLRSHRDESHSDLSCTFTHLSYTFPLKLLTPRTSSKDALNSARRERLKLETSSPSDDRLSGPSIDSSNAPYIFSLEEEAERVERQRRTKEKQKEREKEKPASELASNDKNTLEKAIAALFIVGYGGGLVSGDSISLDIDVGSKTTLLLLTQGSTKVFKSRKSFSSKQKMSMERKADLPPTDGTRQNLSINNQSLPYSSSSTTTSTSTSTSNPTCLPENPSPKSDPTDKNLRIKSDPTTKQVFKCLVRKDSTLILLPDPVTCFTNSCYSQTQFFDLRDCQSSSLVLLDWITPGRMLSVASETSHGRGNVGFEKKAKNNQNQELEAKTAYGHHSGPELWQFESYRSRNEIRVQGETVVRDVLFLEEKEFLDEISSSSSSSFSLPNPALGRRGGRGNPSLASRLFPYTCYATLFLFGPDCQSIISELKESFRRIQQRASSNRTQDLIWSLSQLGPAGGRGVEIATATLGKGEERENRGEAEEPQGQGEIPQAVVVRIAGKETEMVRNWLRENLKELKKIVGKDLYRTALG